MTVIQGAFAVRVFQLKEGLPMPVLLDTSQMQLPIKHSAMTEKTNNEIRIQITCRLPYITVTHVFFYILTKHSLKFMSPGKTIW
jgi:hypothetical protein